MLTCFSVSQCSSVGASFCYLLFYLVGRRLVQYYLPDRVAQWCEQVHLDDNIAQYSPAIHTGYTAWTSL